MKTRDKLHEIQNAGQKVEVREQELEKYVEDSNFSLLVKDNCNQVSSIYNNGG